MATRHDSRAGRFYRDARWGHSPLTQSDDWPSVTHILSVLAKPALVNWAANTERALCAQTAAEFYEDLVKLPAPLSRAAFLTSFETRLGQTKAHQRESEKAKTIGTQCHQIIEWAIRKALGEKVGPEPKIGEQALLAYMAFQEWCQQHTVRPIAIEQTICHPRIGYAGTLDIVADVDGVLSVLDLKTSKAVYEEYFLQTAAYTDALMEMGHWRAEQAYIVRVPKSLDDIGDGPVCEVVACPSRLELMPVFRALCRVWMWWHAADQRSYAAWQAKKGRVA